MFILRMIGVGLIAAIIVFAGFLVKAAADLEKEIEAEKTQAGKT